MKELNIILMIVASCIVIAAVVTRLVDGAAGSGLTLATICSILYLMLNLLSPKERSND